VIETAFHSPVLLLRWRVRCEPSDVQRIRIAIENAYRKHGGPIVYVASIPEEVPTPDADTRNALRAGAQEATTRCASLHLVIEGEGLRRSIIRNVAAAMMLATGGSFAIHTHPIKALAAASKTTPFDVEDVFAQGREFGLF